MSLTAEVVKRKALELGADLVAIGNIERWEGAPAQQDPRQIMPEARSIVAMAFRVMRGSLRGIEEGTFFSNYSAMGYGGLTYLYIPMTVINLAKFIEDHGKEAIPYGHQSDWRAIDNGGRLRRDFSVPVAPGRAAPDVAVHLRIAAYLCGLGEIGWSKMFLTRRFGPRQRLGIVITEAALDPDPVLKPGTLCNRCLACVRDCPAGAISGDRSVKVRLGGHDVEWSDIDIGRCDFCFRGAERKEADDGLPDYLDASPGKPRSKPGWWSPFFRKPRNLYNTGQAVCGARGCTRACMMAMEARGAVENAFDRPFRRRPPWKVDWEQVRARREAAGAAGPAAGEAD
jgi:epoxyqueuosine reductase